MNSAKQIEARRKKAQKAVEAHKRKSTAKRSAIMRAISEEFDEPFYDVISGFAALGHSRFDTANILGVSDYMLGQMLKDFPPVNWPDRYKSVGFVVGFIQAHDRNKKTRGMIEFSGEVKTINEWAMHAGTTRHNLYKRIARWGAERALRNTDAKT